MTETQHQQHFDPENENLQDLIEKWERRHTVIENYVLAWFISHKLLHSLRIQFSTWQGKLIRFLFLGLTLFAIPLGITAISQQWDGAPVWKWAIVSFGFSAMTLNYPLYNKVGMALTSFYRTVQDISGIKRMKAWDRRWFSLGFTFPVGVLFAFVALFTFLNTQPGAITSQIHLGTYFLFLIITYQVGENTFNSILMSIEPFLWAQYKFKMYSISPIDTFSLQRAIKGYDLIVFLNSIFMAFMIAGSAFLLSGMSQPDNSFLLALLIIAYLVIGFLFFLPRIALQQIIRSAKIDELLPLQDRLLALYRKYQELNTSDYENFKRIEEMYYKIKGSQDSLLRLDSVIKIIGNLLLPTITFYLAVVAEVYLSMLLEKFFR